MSEPIILSVPNTKEFWQVQRAAARGEPEAVNSMRGHWDEYQDHAIECFLCGEEVEWPISSMACPDRRNPGLVLLLPICLACEGLTFQQRWHRAGKILRAMWPGVRLYWEPTR